MGNFIKTQNIFSSGEIAPEFYAINTLQGLCELKNMDVLSAGGLKRRAGLKKIKQIANNAILIPFEISESEKYLLVVYDEIIDIYYNDTKISTLVAPWSDSDLQKIQFAQRFNSIFFVHPNYCPQVLTKKQNGFSITPFIFYTNSDTSVNIPFMRFEDTKNISITITRSDIDNNHATFTCDENLWDNSWVYTRLLVNNKQWIIESVQNSRTATVYTNGDFNLPDSAISDWYESAFSDKRGWPISVSFHQNRLVFGGTSSAPNNIWMSKVGVYNNFDTGTGLDDEAIYTSLLSSQHHQISTIVSSDSLQVLTNIGEWAISNLPLTPSNIVVKQHTSVGSIVNRYLPPQQIEGKTVFIAQSGKDIRELDMDALSEKYNATDLCVFSKHLMDNPISMSYNSSTHKLYIVMQNGYMAVLHKYANTDIAAWGKYVTNGSFKYVSVMNNETYVIVKRGNKEYLEKFDTTCLNDAGSYNFSYKITAFPMIVNGHSPRKIRVRKLSLRVMNTKSVFINNTRMQIPNNIYDENNEGYTGDLSMNLSGTQYDTIKPLWSISSDEQLSATILSVTINGWYLI